MRVLYNDGDFITDEILKYIMRNADKIKRVFLTANRLGVEGCLAFDYSGNARSIINVSGASTPVPEMENTFFTIHNHFDEEDDIPSIGDILFAKNSGINISCIAVPYRDDRIKISCYILKIENEEELESDAKYLDDLTHEYLASECITIDDKEICGEEALDFLDEFERYLSERNTKKILEVIL